MNRADFKKLALTRLDDARVLLRNGRSSAAYYIAGYVVECALKACIAKKTRRYDFPPRPKDVSEYYAHDLEKLLKQSGLLDAFKNAGGKLEAYWTTVKDWSEESRYDPEAGRRAKDILAAIDDPAHGVLKCIKRYW